MRKRDILILLLLVAATARLAPGKKAKAPNKAESFTFGVVDLKFDGENIKICEFGDGISSSFNGCDIFETEGATWSKFWGNLEKLEKKILVAKYPIKYLPIKNSLDGLILKFKELFPSVVTVNDGIPLQLNNKLLSGMVFLEEKLEKYKPNFLIIDMGDPKQLSTEEISKITEKILEKLNCKLCVIKPLNSTKCKGVCIVKKENIPRLIGAIFKKSKDGVEELVDHSFDFWTSNKNHEFILIEEYAPSKQIFKNGERYDPTMRVVFTLHDHDETKKINFLGSYWKLPPSPIKAGISENKQHHSFSEDTENKHYLKVELENANKVEKILRKILPDVISKMQKRKIPKQLTNKIIGINEEFSQERVIKYLNFCGIK